MPTQLKPIYLISGLDLEQISSNANKIVMQGENLGYKVILQDTLPDNNFSLFATKQLIKLTFYNGITIKDTNKLIKWCSKPYSEETCLLVIIYGIESINSINKLINAVNKIGTAIIIKQQSSQCTSTSIFDLTNAIKSKSRTKINETLHNLQQENIAPSLILWAVLKELRKLKNYRLIKQAHQVDANIKGITPELTWHKLQILCLGCI